MPINAYLNFNGNTREAVQFYAKVFGLGEPNLLTFGSMPPNPEHPLPPGAEDLIMHANLVIDGSSLMFSDVYPGMPHERGTNNFSLAYVNKDEAVIRDVFNQLKEGGNVTMELQATPWTSCFGMVTDKFGISWQISLESE